MSEHEHEHEGIHELLTLLDAREFSLSDCVGALHSTASFYRSFSIPKRNGGLRKIDSPFPSLECIQKKILHNVLSRMQPHLAAHAYVRGRSAINHASFHLTGKELLTLDIKDFFPSITRQMIFQAISMRGVQNDISRYISILCTLDNKLPQGACTSPYLSNLVFFELDDRLQKLGASLRLVYSRYADDLAFSGERVPRDLPIVIQEILSSKNFLLNKEKIKLKVFGAKKIITGISISSGVAKAPKKFKRALRAQIHTLQRHEDCLSELPVFDPLVFERTLGKINYLLQIEPNNVFALKKKKELSKAHQQFLSLASNRAI